MPSGDTSGTQEVEGAARSHLAVVEGAEVGQPLRPLAVGRCPAVGEAVRRRRDLAVAPGAVGDVGIFRSACYIRVRRGNYL